jgi:hypothetical protein
MAASFGHYQKDNFPSCAMEDENFVEQLEWKLRINKKEIPESLSSCEGFEIGIFFKVEKPKNGNDYHSITRGSILLYDGTQLVQLMENNKKFKLCPLYEVINKFYKLSYAQKVPYTNEVIEPQKIGVFTSKKLNAWFDYCDKHMNALQAAQDALNSNYNANMEKINSIIKALPNAKIEQHKNSWYIKTNLFDITLDLLNDGDSLREKIVFNGTLTDIINLQL